MSDQLALFDTEADAALADARAWRDANPKAYAAIVAWAHEDAATGRCAMQRYIEALRDPRYAAALFVHRTDAVYLVNHNVRSGLTRLVLSEYPALPFHTRKSRADKNRGTEATPRP